MAAHIVQGERARRPASFSPSAQPHHDHDRDSDQDRHEERQRRVDPSPIHLHVSPPAHRHRDECAPSGRDQGALRLRGPRRPPGPRRPSRDRLDRGARARCRRAARRDGRCRRRRQGGLGDALRPRDPCVVSLRQGGPRPGEGGAPPRPGEPAPWRRRRPPAPGGGADASPPRFEPDSHAISRLSAVAPRERRAAFRNPASFDRRPAWFDRNLAFFDRNFGSSDRNRAWFEGILPSFDSFIPFVLRRRRCFLRPTSGRD